MERFKTVALLKSASEKAEEDPYVKVLSDINLIATCIQVLGFNFINLDDLWTSLCEPEKYSGVIFTSPRAVSSVERAIELCDDGCRWSDLRDVWGEKLAYVVGEATWSAAQGLGFSTRGSSSGNAELLVPLITAETSSHSLPLLFPSGNLRREVIPKHLREHDIAFHSLTTYETSPHPHIQDNLCKSYPSNQPDLMVFFSPSGVKFTFPVLSSLGYSMSDLHCVAIGPTTGEALEKALGHNPAAAASKPTPTSLIQAILPLVH